MHTGEPFALKVLSPDAAASPEVHARFRWEAQSAVRLRGEHVARVIDVGLLPDGAPYLVMEYLRGLDLAAELARRGPLMTGEAVDHVLQAGEALAEAHAHGIVHRDVKPSNLFLTARPDGTPLIKVLDFGLSTAAVAHNVLGRTDTVMGTPGYMSPEQLNAVDHVDPRSDVWALGVVLYELLLGRRPFDADTYARVAVMIATEPPPPMDARVPPPLQGVVLRCLEKDPTARFPTVAALAAALAPFARDPRAAALIVDRTQRMSRGLRTALEVIAPAPAAVSMALGGHVAGPAPGRRYGIIALSASIVVVSAAALIVATGGDTRASGDGVRAQRPAAPPASVAAPAVQPRPAGEVVPSAEDREAAQARKATACGELRAQRKWQALETCASELDALGGGEQVKELRAVASQEALNEVEDVAVRRALHDGDLRAAEASLALITRDSVYHPALRDAFGQAEARAVEDARRNAQDLARERDCAGLRRLLGQLEASATERVLAAAQAVRCGERTEQARVATAQPARAAAEPARTAAEPARTAEAAPSPSPRAPSSAARSCDAAHVDDLMIRAATQYDAGSPKTALSLAAVALACKQTPRMYWLAVLYACAARDLAAARQYFRDVPANLQSGIERKCQQEQLDVRSR